MVDKIEVVINNGVFREKEILVEPSKNLCCIDKNEYQIKDEEISKILSILSTWKYEYGNNENIIDCQEFSINVFSNDTKTTYHGKGNFPTNYLEFLNIFGGIQNGR